MAQQKNHNEHLNAGGLAAAAEYLLSLFMAFFLIQAYRDIIISPGGFKDVRNIVCVMSIAPLAAGALCFLIPWARFYALAGALAAMAGRAVLLQASVPQYYLGEYLVFAGFSFYFVGRLVHISRAGGQGKSATVPAAMFSAGLLTAPILHLSLRSGDLVQNNTIIWIMIALAAAALLAATLLPQARPVEGPAKPAEEPKRLFLAGFSILLIAVPMHFVVEWALRPDIFSGITNVSFRVMTYAVKFALFAAAVGAMEFVKGKSHNSVYRDRVISSVAAMIIFGLLFRLPQGWLGFFLIVGALSGALSLLAPPIVYFSTRPIRCRALFLGLGMSVTSFIVVGLHVFMIENHAPRLNWWLLGFESIGMFMLWFATRGAREKSKASLSVHSAAAFVGIIAFALFVLGWPYAQRNKADAGRKVIASLYTWYGVPGYPSGAEGFESLWQNSDAWSTKGSTVENLSESANKLNSAIYVSGVSDGKNKSRIILSTPINSSVLNLKSRTYIFFNAKFYSGHSSPGDPDISYISTATFYVRINGMRYFAGINTSGAFISFPFKLVFPQQFHSVPDTGPDEMGFIVNYLEKTKCLLVVEDFDVSRWKHWDEDYHKAIVNGKWRNDPPDTLAAAHHVNYTGQPWPDIEPYSPDGYYDSWDPVVMRSQMRLMEKAGIDAVMIMHPSKAEVVGMIIDTLDQLKSPLKVLYYGRYTSTTGGVAVDALKRYGSNPRFMKVGGKPVWILEPTGLESKPYKVYEKEFAELRANTGAFLVGDQYVPPKEEMLSLLDGSYYYDTTGLYRARWGSPLIEVAQPDASFVTGFGHLLTIFRGAVNATHARNGLHIATVISGFDNTAVHGFNGSPFYDGHPGTIIKRQNGLTYAETWKEAIRSGADWAGIVSWNELHEGTEIEPTKEDGVFFVQKTKPWADAFRAGKIPDGLK